MSAAGVYCNSIGLEPPIQLGVVERHGGLWKKVAAKVVQERDEGAQMDEDNVR